MPTFDHLHYFETAKRSTVVALAFDLHDWINQWQELRERMIRRMPTSFTRDEWAYLIRFLAPESLLRPWIESFGKQVLTPVNPVNALLRPRGPIAVWLPNNVSLLGPLTLILASMSSSSLRIKAGSRADDLTSSFVAYVRESLQGGSVADYFGGELRVEQFGREDVRNREMALECKMRIVFGSDGAVRAIGSLPRPVDSVGIAFPNHSSEVWVEVGAMDDSHLQNLIRVFAIYGRAGCTSPQRVVILGGSETDARNLQEALLRLWPLTMREPPPMHTASGNILSCQWAAAGGWNAATAARNGAVFAVGNMDAPSFEGLMALPIVSGSVERALRTVPENIQTIGHCLNDPADPKWLGVLASSSVKRFVPISEMHHFGPVWDGNNFWRQLFEEVEVVYQR